MNLVLAVMFLYVLYGVIRTGARDGIGQAYERSLKQDEELGGNGE